MLDVGIATAGFHGHQAQRRALGIAVNLRTRVFIALTFSVISLIGTTLQAEEGFFLERDLPAQLASAWEATFIVYPSHKRTENGTAFVIDKEEISYSSEVRLTLLTADHVVQKFCGKGLGPCDMILSASVGFDMETRRNILMDDKNRTIYGANVRKRASKQDLALLEVIVDEDKYDSLTPIPFGRCEELYTDRPIYLIGFPHTNKRTTKGARFIEDLQHRIRRWSQGYIVDYISYSSVYMIGTTADAIHGASGGPALNHKGEFWGLLSKVAASKSDGHPYQGIEGSSPQNREWHSLVVGCADIKAFLSR